MKVEPEYGDSFHLGTYHLVIEDVRVAHNNLDGGHQECGPKDCHGDGPVRSLVGDALCQVRGAQAQECVLQRRPGGEVCQEGVDGEVHGKGDGEGDDLGDGGLQGHEPVGDGDGGDHAVVGLGDAAPGEVDEGDPDGGLGAEAAQEEEEVEGEREKAEGGPQKGGQEGKHGALRT